MKILQVNNVYADKSTGKLTKSLHTGLKQAGMESVVVYGRGKTYMEDGVIRLCPQWYGKLQSLLSKVTGMPYGGCWLSTLRLCRIIRREKPDVVHLQCINGNFVNIYRLVQWLKKNRIRTVASLHAEFLYTGNCGHAFSCTQWQHGCKKCPDLKRATGSCLLDRTSASWKKMKNAFAGFEKDCIIAPVSPWTEERAKQSAILKDFRFQTIYNGIDTKGVFRYRGVMPKKDTVLLVTAQFSADKNHAKGGWYLMALAKRMPNVKFLVAGKAAIPAELPDNLTLLGPVWDQQKLAELYQEACVSIQVSRRETFCMPCAESLCCGTPVVGFKAGAPEQISLPAYSEFVEFGDLDALQRVLTEWLSCKNPNRCKIAEQAANVYSDDTMVQKFMELYGRIGWN